MKYSIECIGDADGEGHDIWVRHTDDGMIIVESRNPDTGHQQVVVMLPQQWRRMFDLLLERYGVDHCRFRSPLGACTMPQTAI